MHQALADRIEYGRAIRLRAECLLDAHGRTAAAHARLAALASRAEAERSFLEAVAARVTRLTSEPRWEPVF